MRRAFGHDDFQGGPDVPFAKMPGFGAAVAGADDDMNMQGRLALRIIGDVANQRSDLDTVSAGGCKIFSISFGHTLNSIRPPTRSCKVHCIYHARKKFGKIGR